MEVGIYYVFKPRITPQLFFTPYLLLHHSSTATTWISLNMQNMFFIKIVLFSSVRMNLYLIQL